MCLSIDSRIYVDTYEILLFFALPYRRKMIRWPARCKNVILCKFGSN